jgi:hypothetical protein
MSTGWHTDVRSKQGLDAAVNVWLSCINLQNCSGCMVDRCEDRVPRIPPMSCSIMLMTAAETLARREFHDLLTQLFWLLDCVRRCNAIELLGAPVIADLCLEFFSQPVV